MAAETAYGDYAEIIALTRQGEHVAAQDWLVVAPIATGLIVTAILVIIGQRQRLQTAVALSAFAAIAIFEAALFAHVWDVGVVVMTMSDWRPPFGIAFVCRHPRSLLRPRRRADGAGRRHLRHWRLDAGRAALRLLLPSC